MPELSVYLIGFAIGIATGSFLGWGMAFYFLYMRDAEADNTIVQNMAINSQEVTRAKERIYHNEVR